MIGRKATTSPLVEEFRICNTPVIGAYIFWRFAKSFVQEAKKLNKVSNPHLLLFSFVAAIFSDRRILDELKSRRSISSFRRYLTGAKKGVLFDGIHIRVKEMLPYTLSALDIAYSCGILRMNRDDGTIEPVAVRAKRGPPELVSESISDDSLLAETLGRWFAKYGSPVEVAKKLEVVL